MTINPAALAAAELVWADPEAVARARAAIRAGDVAQLRADVRAAMVGPVEQLRRREAEAPLAVSRLWTHPTARMDQRRQVAGSLRVLLSLCLGGNRSGKTYGAYQADIAVALGRSHPHTQAWCRLNGIDPMSIPDGPGEVIVVAQSNSVSRRVHRAEMDRLLPPGAKWIGRDGLTEARVTIEVPGHRFPAVIWYKSIDQGPESFKGSKARRIHIDEEPEGVQGRQVLEECLRAVAAAGGHVVITATPQEGLTWMVEELVMGKRWGCVTSRLHSLHNRFVDDRAGMIAHLKGMDPDERRVRARGEWVDRRGAIYTTWRRGLHLVPSSVALAPYTGEDGESLVSIPASWPRFRALDFGQTNPTAIVWAALAPDGVLHIYRAMEESHVPYEVWASRIHTAEGAHRDPDTELWTGHTERIEMCWGDPSSPDAIRTLQACDVPCMRAHREVAVGISAVRSGLRLLAHGRPGLVVHSDAEGGTLVARRIEGYRYDEKSKTNRPLKVGDHIPDALRYLCRGVSLTHGHLWRPTTDPGETDADQG